MQELFTAINTLCAKIQVVSDLFWNFPTNLEWYAAIPILGNLSLSVILLLGSGLYFSYKLRFIQLRKFIYGLKVLKSCQQTQTGITPLAAFFLSTAMRVGPGNILGVTGAISVGGPGALFWMWVSAFLGMATAYTESTLAQIFKEKKNDEYIGGLSFYGRRLLNDSAAVGLFLSLMYIIYALLCLPAQGFNTVSAVGQIVETVTGQVVPTNSPLYWASFAVLLVVITASSFGGIRKVTRITDILVPIMAVIYVLTVFVLIITNVSSVPYFFTAVFGGAFNPEAVFGGALGLALVQGVKRGLMSNEAGQGTITMSAAASNAKHPCDQGCIQAVAVFLDTIIICTLTGFVIVMAHAWHGEGGAAWMALGKLPKFVASAGLLSGGGNPSTVVSILVSLCFGLFAFTSLLGFMSFTEICSNRISTSSSFINTIRVLCLVVISFGVLTSIAGLDLGALWNLSDFANILIAYCNIPLLYIGFKYVQRATEHFEKGADTPFTSKTIGVTVPVWDEKAKDEDCCDCK